MKRSRHGWVGGWSRRGQGGVVLLLAGMLWVSTVRQVEGGAAPAPAGVGVRVAAEHPRLFLRPGDLAGLKERCQREGEVKEAYEILRGFAYGTSRNPNLWVAPEELTAILVAWQVEERDPKLLGRAREYVRAFREAAGDSWTRPRMLKALALAYDWLHGDLTVEERRDLAARMQELAGQMRKAYRHSDYNNHVYLEYGPLLYAGLALAGDGLADGWAQEVLAEAEKLLKEHFIPTINQVGGGTHGGWHESMSYWSFFAYELAHQLEVWRTATGENLFQRCRALRGAAGWLMHGTRPHDGSMAPVADIHTPYRWGWQEGAYLPLLAARYGDGLAQEAALRVRPKQASRAWPWVLWFDPAIKPSGLSGLPTGHLFPGIGWASMRSSWEADATWALFVCGDYYAGHQHMDQNSFVIARSGDLAVDAGEYGAKGTLFHNTVWIGEGQRAFGNDPRRYFGPTAPGSTFDTGEILAFEENQFFTQVVGDASNAYGSFKDGRRVEPAPRFVRRFLFLKPSTFVIEDQVRAAGGQGDIRWLLHSRREPELGTGTIRIAEGDGELLCQTLLPREARRTSQTQTGGQKQRTDYRVEVAGPAGANAVRFLHVLHTRRQGETTSVAQTELIEHEQEGRLELTVATGTHRYRVILPADDPGEIEVAQADGRVLLARRPLAAGILPYGPEGVRLLERWDSAYRGGRRATWDTGRPSSEVVKAVEDGTLRPCRVVELGCGSGNTAIYLAGLGFDVTAIDIAPTALKQAEEKARKAGVRVRWLLADVLAPPSLEPFDLIFDRGCYHGVRRIDAAGYVETIRRLTRPGSRLLLLAGNANEPPPHYGPPRVKEEELRGDFSALFEFEQLREIRFDTADPEAKGALAWSALLRRKQDR